MPTVLRIQDSEGRGPWRPGFSHLWVEDRPDLEALRPMFVEFDMHAVFQAARDGTHLGCGVRSIEQLRRWFTPAEYIRLLRFGYRAVRMDASRILAESPIQCVFERSKPLRRRVETFDLYAPVAAEA